MFKRGCALFGIIFIAFFVISAQGATVHGEIYAWPDLEKPLKNVIIDVNSTPAQSKVATNGTYSFVLSQGNYLIKARYYRNNILEYIAEEEIQIDREGDFIIDLLVFPPSEPDFEPPGKINLSSQINEDNNVNKYIIIILVLLSLAVIFYFLKRKNKANEPIELQESPDNIAKTKNEIQYIPGDLREIYDLIIKMGGRTTQKDMRKELNYSETKISLILTDLEDRGLIKKIKKGRTNIIIAHEQTPKK